MRASFSPISLAGFLLAAAPLIQPAAALNLYSDFIFTREVTYCSAGRAVEVERFDIRYYRNNQSIGFDINARSTAPNLSADLNIQLFAYGKSYLNISANLCDILVGALCPLPQYQFDGTFAYILPDSVNIDLPSIAFSVPDLDAYAQVILTNQATGEEALCLGATLSNGKTVYDSWVGWAVGGLTIAAFVGALIHSFWPLTPSKSGPEWRFATILSYFQHVAMCGFLSLDYPVVYKNFTLNFAWAQGLIYMRPINAAINRMRYMTGGVDREGQTFSVIAENSVALFAAGRDNVVDSRNPGGSARSYAQAAAYTVPTVQDVPTYNLISGIETTAESLDITYPNAFMTVFIVFLLLLAVMTAICLLAALGVAIYTLLQRRKQSPSPMQPGLGARSNLRYFIWTNFLRIFLVAYTPLMIFIFWQFLHLFDSGWLAIFIAAITLVWLHLAILGIYWHLSKVSHAALNGGQEKTSLRWTTVSHQFKRSGYGYLLLLSGAAFISAAFVAFAQGHALVQVIPLIVVEVAVFLAFCIWRPFANRGANALMIIISIFKILAYGLLVAFYARLTYNGIIKAVLGFVLIAVQGIMTLVLFCVTVYNLFAGILWSRRARKEAEAENHAAMSERVERPAGPFIHPSYLSRGESYRPSDAMAGGRYEGQTSPTEEDPMYRPPVSQLHVPGTPDTAAEYAAPGQTYGADGPGLGLAPAAYPSRTEGASIDDSRTVVAPSSEGSNPAAPHKTGSRFNPKNWKKGSEDSV